MIEQIPDRMDIGIEGKDILSSANTILNAMSSIREEFIQQRDTSPKKNEKNSMQQGKKTDEYIHLSYRLASALKALDDVNAIEHLETIRKAMEKTPALLDYDYLQDGFWKEKYPKLNKALEKILIAVRKENFSSLKEKHHIMQAMKYMLTENQSIDERLNILDTITPFSPNSTDRNKEFFEKELEKLKIMTVKNSIALRVKDEGLDKIIDIVSSLGFDHLQVLTNKKGIEEAKQKYPSVKVVKDTLEKVIGDSKTKRFLRKTMPYFKWLTYPILGNMPGYLQRKLENYVGKEGYKAYGATMISMLTNMGIYISIVYSLSCKYPSESDFGWIPIVSGIVAFLGGIVEGNVRGDQAGSGSHAGLLGKILFSPVEQYWKFIDRQKQQYNCIMEIDLARKSETADTTNYFTLFNELGKKELEKKFEENLVWSEWHHNMFGKYFSNDLLKGYKSKLKHCKQQFDRKNSIWNCYNERTAGDYTNLALLACKKDERYVLSLITQNKPQIKEINQTLIKPISSEEKLAEIAQKFDTDFVRLIKYENCTKVEDYEAM